MMDMMRATADSFTGAPEGDNAHNELVRTATGRQQAPDAARKHFGRTMDEADARTSSAGVGC